MKLIMLTSFFLVLVSGCGSDNSDKEIRPTSIRWDMGSEEVTSYAGLCNSASTITSVEVNPRAVENEETLTVSKEPNTLSLYTDSACTTEFSGTQIKASEHTSPEIYYKVDTSNPGTYTLTASGSSLGSSSLVLNIHQYIATIGVSSATDIKAGTCGELSLLIYNNDSVISAPGFDRTFTVTSDHLYKDDSCATKLTELTIPARSLGFTIYVKKKRRRVMPRETSLQQGRPTKEPPTASVNILLTPENLQDQR